MNLFTISSTTLIFILIFIVLYLSNLRKQNVKSCAIIAAAVIWILFAWFQLDVNSNRLGENYGYPLGVMLIKKIYPFLIVISIILVGLFLYSLHKAKDDKK